MKYQITGLLFSILLFIPLLSNGQQTQQNHDSTSIGPTVPSTMAGSGGQSSNNAVVAPMYCPHQAVTWNVGGLTCSGTANMVPTGGNRTVTATGTWTGSATYTCTTNNTFTGPNPGATCNGPPYRMWTYNGFSFYRPTVNAQGDPCQYISPPVPSSHSGTCVWDDGTHINTTTYGNAIR